jgi:hypothetical protein
MLQLARHEGYCCLWALFHLNRRIMTGAFAVHYGVSRQTIKYWRKRYRAKSLSCEGCSGCLKPLIDKRAQYLR